MEKYSVISPDLTHNDPNKTNAVGSGAENYGVVFSLAESPKRAGLLWAGTDDGRLWITENDGGKWTELTNNLPEPARGQWVVRIEAQNIRDETRDRAAAIVASCMRAKGFAKPR
jgi:hypothetical protein